MRPASTGAGGADAAGGDDESSDFVEVSSPPDVATGLQLPSDGSNVSEVLCFGQVSAETALDHP